MLFIEACEDVVGIPQDFNLAHMRFNIAFSSTFFFCLFRGMVFEDKKRSDVSEAQIAH